MDTSEVQAIVLDNGSSISKAGFAGETTPKTVIPTLVNHCTRPIQRGIIVDWDAMEQLWQNIFQTELKVDPKNYSVLLSDVSLNPPSARETMTQIMFEKFSVPATYVANAASLSLFASARTTGVIVESGDGVTQVVPIKDGKIITQGISKWDFGGQDLNLKMVELLKQKGVDVDSTIAKQIKEQLGYVAMDLKEEEKKGSAIDKTYTLPDGSTITVGIERCKCPEFMFQPKLMGSNNVGIHEMIYDAIQKAGSTSIQKQLEKNIVISGGNSLFNGMIERMNKELSVLTSSSVSVLTPSDRSKAVWVGGSILAYLPTFQTMWISKQEYEEEGAKIVHKKYMYFVVSCVACKEKHRKCDRVLPSCTNCQERGISCVYQPPKKRRRRLDQNCSEEETEEEWNSSIVLQNSNQLNNSIPTTQQPPPKQIALLETNLIDKNTIQTYSKTIPLIDKRSATLSELIFSSLSFIDEFESFKNILALEPTVLPEQIQTLSRQFKLNFAFAQSVQAVTYVQPYITPTDSAMSKENLKLLDDCFHTILNTIMSDTSIYMDTPNNLLLAWIWASLSMICAVHPSKVSSLTLFLKNVDSFLENNACKYPQKASLFSTTIPSTMQQKDHIYLLERLKNNLQMLNRTINDDVFYNSSLVDCLNDLKKSVQFDLGIFQGADVLYTIICRLIQLIEQLCLKFSLCGTTCSFTELEELIVQILVQFDTIVHTFSQLIVSSPFVQDHHFFSIYLGVYELKLRFVEELQSGIAELQNQQLINNIGKARISTCNQIFDLFKKYEPYLLRRGQYNVKRVLIKIVQIHMEQNIDVEKLQFELALLNLVQTSYMNSSAVESLIQKVSEYLQSRSIDLLLTQSNTAMAGESYDKEKQNFEIDELLGEFL